MCDPYKLKRFVEAQDPVYLRVLEELEQGRKRTHWMWFVFPQIAGLGFSAAAQRFAIASEREAAEYLRHPILGERLITCTQMVNRIQGRSVQQVFPYPDDLKFCSSMTLFSCIDDQDHGFRAALQKYYDGKADPITLRILGRDGK